MSSDFVIPIFVSLFRDSSNKVLCAALQTLSCRLVAVSLVVASSSQQQYVSNKNTGLALENDNDKNPGANQSKQSDGVIRSPQHQVLLFEKQNKKQITKRRRSLFYTCMSSIYSQIYISVASNVIKYNKFKRNSNICPKIIIIIIF